QCARDLNRALVPLDDAPNDGEPEAVAPRTFRREEWLEDAALRIFRHPAPGIVYADGGPVAVAARPDPAGSSRPHGLQGIHEQIRHDLAQLFGPALDRRRLALHPNVVVDAVALGFILPPRPRELDDLPDNVEDLDAAERTRLTGPRELLNSPDGVSPILGGP